MTKDLEEERQLIMDAKRDPDRFAALYEKYFYEVFMFCQRRVSDPTLASDLCSQTFLKAMLHLPSYEFKGVPFGAWLLRIASNEINQSFRKGSRNREVQLDESHLRILAQDVEVPESSQNRQLLVDALNELTLEESQLIELRFFERLSFAAIAELYDITEANAKMKVYRILKRMRNHIAQRVRS